jgi:Tubulin like
MERNGHLKFSPTLIVGLGGTGALAVQYIKRKIRKQLKKYARKDVPEKVPFIEYLVMDTTSQEEFVEDLTGDEHLNLGHINVPRLLSGIDRNPDFAEALRWFPRHINPGQIDSGARGVRHIGRLCFFDKLPTIERSIRNKVERIANETNVEKELKEHFLGLSVDAHTIDVHLVSSLCGGTGSACLLDTAYLIKDIIYELLKEGANSTAHLVTTEPFVGDSSINATSREYIRYNFAIALSEIERFMDFDVSVSEAGPSMGARSWEAKYLSGRTVSSIEKPFSVTYLLGYKEGESISKKNICEIIGDTIALQTTHPESRLVKGLVDNVKAHVINQKDAAGKIRAYSSYNTRILSAEFSEQTVEASTVFASEAILDAVCGAGVAPGLDEVLDQLRSETRMQSEKNDRFIYELSKEKFNEMYANVDNEIGINKELFARVGDELKQQNASKGWSLWGQRAPSMADKIAKGWDRYKREKEPCRERAQMVIRDFEEWVVMVKSEVPGKISLLLEEGRKFRTVEGALKRLLGDIDDIMIDLAPRRQALAVAQDGDGAWVESAILKNQYSADAASRLRSDVLTPVYNSFETGLGELKEFVQTLIEKCEKAAQCLSQTKEMLKEKSSRSSSLTESSLWTREKVSNKIKDETPTLVKAFIKEMERQFTVDNKDVDRRIAFLWHLDPNEPERRKEVLDLLRDVARNVVEKVIQIEEIDFNRGNGGGHQDVIGSEEINKFIELAAPAWQIERAGEDIAEISITNCPAETKLGRIISNMGKSITFSENSQVTSQIIVFRSEHGVSADRLLNVDLSMDAVRRKLLIEEKAHINDLSLNPEWQIEEPGTAMKVDMLYALFSLGVMFEMIQQRPETYFFFDENGKEITLVESVSHARNVERSTAFSKFLKLGSKHDKKVASLISRIEAHWGLGRKGDIHQFKQAVADYIELLESEKQLKVKSDDEDSAIKELAQLDREIASLRRLVIRPLEEYIESEQLKKKRQDPGRTDEA